MQKFKRTALLILIVVFIAAGLATAYFVTGNFGEGFRVGTVTKLVKRGVFFKTYEGQLDMGFLNADPNSGVSTRIWEFSVKADEEKVLKDIDHAIEGGKRVKLYYHEKFFKITWFGDTQFFIYKVEEVKPTP